MPVITFPPLRSPTPKPLIYPWKQPFSIDPSCDLCLLPIRDDKWYDFSGKGNHGTIEGAIWTAKGRYGPALYFDGINDYATLGNDNSLNVGTGDFTLELFIKTATPSGFHRIYIKRAATWYDIYLYASALPSRTPWPLQKNGLAHIP